MLRIIKYSVVGVGGAAVLGGLVFGTELGSYVHSSARSVQSAVREQVPIEFEIQRARDIVEQIVPEMQSQIQVIAYEEVELASIRSDIARATLALSEQRREVALLRDSLDSAKIHFVFAGRSYDRPDVKTELARRFERLKQAEQVLAGKEKLLETRQRSLAAAVDLLEKMRGQKAVLEDKIASLDGQFQLVKAAATGSGVRIDSSKLAKAEKLIGEIRKRLDVAEKQLAYEARFVEQMPITGEVVEQELLAEVDAYLSKPGEVESRREALSLDAEGGR